MVIPPTEITEALRSGNVHKYCSAAVFGEGEEYEALLLQQMLVHMSEQKEEH